MKWARPSTQSPPPYKSTKQGQLTPEQKKERSKYIEVLNPASVEDLHKKGFREWLICSKKKERKVIAEFTADDRFSYESYIGGFLAYYEIHVSKSEKRENRTIFFDWGCLNEAVPLTIYLKPVNKPYYDNKGKLIGNTKAGKPVGWKSAPPKALRSPLGPPPAAGQTDPPVPPVPPPPPPNAQAPL